MHFHIHKVFRSTILLLMSTISFHFFSYAQSTQNPIQISIISPSFLREGDRVDIKVSLKNRSRNEITGQVALQVIDDSTQQSADGWFRNFFPNQFFTLAGDSTQNIQFYLEIPYEYGRKVLFKIFVRNESIFDSTQIKIPVMANRFSSFTKQTNSHKWIVSNTTILRNGHKKTLHELNYVIRKGDRIVKTWRLNSHAPYASIQIEENLCSSLSVQKTLQFQKSGLDKIMGTLKKGQVAQLVMIAQHTGSFVNNFTLLKNNKGEIIDCIGADEVLHIEEN